MTEQLCRKISLDSFSDQLCTESLENLISQLQLDLVTSLSLQQLHQKSFQLSYAQLSFQKLSQKSLESLSEQLGMHYSEGLSDQLRQYSFQSFSFQLSRSSLDGLIRQLDLVSSLSLALELGSRSCSEQLQTLNSDNSSFEQRAFNCAALLGSTQLGHKQPQQSRQSFQLTDVQLCQCMAQRGASNPASHNKALRTSLSTTNLTRRSLCTRSSQPALTTSPAKAQQVACRELCLQFFCSASCSPASLSTTSSSTTAFGNKRLTRTMSFSQTAWAQELDKHLANKTFPATAASATASKQHTREEVQEGEA